MFQCSKKKYMFGICVWFFKKVDQVDFGIIVRGRDETYLTRWALTIFKIITQLPLRTLVLLFKNRPEVISKLCLKTDFETMFSKQLVLKMDDQIRFSFFGHIYSMFKHWRRVFKLNDQTASHFFYQNSGLKGTTRKIYPFSNRRSKTDI